MRRLVLINLVSWLGLAAPIAAQAQALTQAASSNSASQAPPPAQPPAQPAAPAASAAAVDETRSLFDVMPKQFVFGGRVTSIEGDPARFQRYQDIRDGVLFTNARY